MTTSSLLDEYPWLKKIFLITVLFFTSFWIYFFVVEYGSSSLSPSYIEHELAFPVPDIVWIISLSLLSIYWLKRNNAKGIVSTVATGSALFFLGLIDVSYNVQQGIYSKSIGDLLVNSACNLWCLGCGIYLIKVGYELLLKYSSSRGKANG